jgi:hypothetical protein
LRRPPGIQPGGFAATRPAVSRAVTRDTGQGEYVTIKRRRHSRSTGTTSGGPGPIRHSTIQRFIPHPDVVVRHRVVLPVAAAEACDWIRRFDWAQLCLQVGPAVEDMRHVPRFVAEVAHRASRLPATASFIVDDALRSGFTLLAEQPGRHLVLGAVGKLWKAGFQLVRLNPEEFVAFQEPKYAKLATGFLVLPYGRTRSVLLHEAHLVATDASARAHLERAWRTAEPYVDFFMRRAFRTLAGVARERQTQLTSPPWRPARRTAGFPG